MIAQVRLIAATCMLWAAASLLGWSQTAAPAPAAPPAEYQFTDVYRVDCTPVKSQGRTGTCWCFSTASFLESEAMRQGKGIHNLSEIFVVRNTYVDKVRNFILRQGKTNFGEGAMAHDLFRSFDEHGIVPDEVYTGLVDGATTHDHGELEGVLLGLAETYSKRRPPGANWDEVINAVLDVYLGKAPQEFSYQGQTYTPQSFAESLGISGDDYVGLTSYTHHPFGAPFALECPDNFAGGQFENMPIDDLVAAIDQALAQGYSVVWDGDVSEKGFLMNNGVAVLPAEGSAEFAKAPGPEQAVTQEMRQQTFENFSTAEEHLMHLVGLAKDQNGNKYYIIKNSWGELGNHKGFLYMSENYLRLKTVAVTMHRDALPAKKAGSETSQRTRPTPATNSRAGG